MGTAVPISGLVDFMQKKGRTSNTSLFGFVSLGDRQSNEQN